jgi:hypothetical protein
MNRFLGNDFLEILVQQSNLCLKCIQIQNSPKSLAWKEVSCNNHVITDMKKFLVIIMLMCHVKQDKTRDYWSTNKVFEIPVFDKLMSRNKFEQIWNVWHYRDSSILNDEIDYIKSAQF